MLRASLLSRKLFPGELLAAVLLGDSLSLDDVSVAANRSDIFEVIYLPLWRALNPLISLI